MDYKKLAEDFGNAEISLAEIRNSMIDLEVELDAEKSELLLSFEGKTWMDPETGVMYPCGNAEQRKAIVDNQLSYLIDKLTLLRKSYNTAAAKRSSEEMKCKLYLKFGGDTE